jgi:hypothetical protein
MDVLVSFPMAARNDFEGFAGAVHGNQELVELAD